MEQYIPKAALVVEIKKLMYAANIEADIASTGECFNENIANTKYQLCKYFLGVINTLEVKEVDLNEEIESYFKGFGKFASVGIDDCIDIAKHFFELGMAVSNKAQKGEKV